MPTVMPSACAVAEDVRDSRLLQGAEEESGWIRGRDDFGGRAYEDAGVRGAVTLVVDRHADAGGGGQGFNGGQLLVSTPMQYSVELEAEATVDALE